MMSGIAPEKTADSSEEADASKLELTAGPGLRVCVQAALEAYFADLRGHAPGDLYRLVIAEIERPLLETVLQHTRGNQSRAAQILGVNRSTLRKKLRQYELDQ
jgi:Fis family transcriptional regulator, factor for inversion stimulation protein